MASEGIQGISIPEVLMSSTQRAQLEGGSHKYRGYFLVYLIKPWVNPFVD